MTLQAGDGTAFLSQHFTSVCVSQSQQSLHTWSSLRAQVPADKKAFAPSLFQLRSRCVPRKKDPTPSPKIIREAHFARLRFQTF